MTFHIPIMVTEILESLHIEKNDIVLDATAGLGGHSEAFLNKLSSSGLLICSDQDNEAISFCQEKFKENTNVKVIKSNFSNILSSLADLKITPNKILLDLGYSSYQLDQSNRGFSFLKDEPLDMRMSQENRLSAKHILHTYSLAQLSDMFYQHGDLIHNKKLCQNIIDTRKKESFKTTFQLVDCIKKSYFFGNNRKNYMKICSQVFQALRIEVNKEFDHINSFLNQLNEQMTQNSRISFLTFHSSEDRLIKHWFKKNKELFKPINKKVIQASQSEILQNSRSKPAKLRTYIKL